MAEALKVELTDSQLRELARMQAEEAAKLYGCRSRRLLSFTEAAKELGVSSATIRRRVDAGIIGTPKGFPDKISPYELDRLLGASDDR